MLGCVTNQALYHGYALCVDRYKLNWPAIVCIGPPVYSAAEIYRVLLNNNRPPYAASPQQGGLFGKSGHFLLYPIELLAHGGGDPPLVTGLNNQSCVELTHSPVVSVCSDRLY